MSKNTNIKVPNVNLIKERDVFIPKKLEPYITISNLEQWISFDLGFMILFKKPNTPHVKGRLKIELSADTKTMSVVKVS